MQSETAKINTCSKLLFFVLILISSPGHSYVKSLTGSGKAIKWNDSTEEIRFYLDKNSAPSQIGSNDFESIFVGALNSWNELGKFNLTYEITNSTASRRNDVYFSDFLVGSNALGVTRVSFNQATGQIIETDIMLSTFLVNKDSSTDEYLGNILTHEIGHALGLSHSQIAYSTMFYKATRGQHTLSEDDKNGFYDVYSIKKSGTGTVKGKIVGGQDLVGIFGSHVQLISVDDLSVVVSTVSEPNGDFQFNNVDKSKEYFLKVAPLELLETLPTYYEDVTSGFCLGYTDYKPSLWQGCGSSSEGKPVNINFQSQSTIDAGFVTIRCNTDVPAQYLLDREDGYELDLSKRTNTYLGYFSEVDLRNSAVDKIHLDLSNVALPALSTGDQNLLEISIMAQSLYSPLKIKSKVIFQDYTEIEYGATDWIDNDLNPQTDLKFTILLSPVASSNVFDIEVTPQHFETLNFNINGKNEVLTGYLSGVSNYSLDDYFPDYDAFKAALPNYLFSARAYTLKSNGDKVYLKSPYVAENYELYDNRWCPDADLSYKLSPNTVSTTSSIITTTTSNEDSGEIALGGCGQINTGSGPGNPGSAPLIAMMMGILLFLLPRIQYLK
ncbi:MAG: matrixin family metalloprotease [Bacteriovoracaceae bacterium]